MIFRDEIDLWSCNQEESSAEECINKGQVCDDNDDCSNMEDELKCPGTCFKINLPRIKKMCVVAWNCHLN